MATTVADRIAGVIADKPLDALKTVCSSLRIMASLSVDAVVKALGGPTAVARACGVTIAAVGGWRTLESIPPRHWLRIWRMAKERGLDWRPPGSEGLDLVILPPSADDAEGRMFTQCSHVPPITEAAAWMTALGRLTGRDRVVADRLFSALALPETASADDITFALGLLSPASPEDASAAPQAAQDTPGHSPAPPARSAGRR